LDEFPARPACTLQEIDNQTTKQASWGVVERRQTCCSPFGNLFAAGEPWATTAACSPEKASPLPKCLYYPGNGESKNQSKEASWGVVEKKADLL
jgi:hypothetical protein